MPNTHVRAAAEGMPAINRRQALFAATGAIAALAVAPKAHAGADDTAAVLALIKAHRVAEANFLKALDADGEWRLPTSKPTVKRKC
jgi:hypothetical protein